MVYSYTKPRGPIAAMYSSPGPCYNLPSLVGKKCHDPRSTYSRAPAYPFGVKRDQHAESSGPGPCYSISPQILRTGRESIPRCSLASRTATTPLNFTPGPVCYSPERSRLGYYERSPAFTFGSKHTSKSMDCYPGPNTYHPPTIIGSKIIDSRCQKAPSFSMSGRTKFGSYHQLEQTPGPGSYSTPDLSVLKSNSPKFSISGRYKIDPPNSCPGPGAYKNEGVWINRVRWPRHTFGIKHSQYAVEMLTR